MAKKRPSSKKTTTTRSTKRKPARKIASKKAARKRKAAVKKAATRKPASRRSKRALKKKAAASTLPPDIVVDESGELAGVAGVETVAAINLGTGNSPTLPKVLPVLPIRGTSMFPGTIVPIGVGRPSSRQLLEEQLGKQRMLVLAAQKHEVEDEPGPNDLFTTATVGTVMKVIRQPDDGLSIIVHGQQRIRIKKYTHKMPYLKAEIAPIAEKSGRGKAFMAEVDQLRNQAVELIDLSPNAPEEAETVLMNIEDPGNLADFLAANLPNLDLNQKQALLEEVDVKTRLRIVHKHVAQQLDLLRLQEKIHQDVQTSIGDSQRRIFLREQLKAIQKELGEDEDGSQAVVDELREKLQKANPPEPVMLEANKELDRMEMVPPASPEYSVIMSYVELIAELPWNIASDETIDLQQAQTILDRDHFGLEKVKRRLIEYLAVRKLNPEAKGTILCLAGPPGVGKTSLGQSIADALGRKFSRMAFGGIRDESEIRGHRRTYIGAMPGRIIQAIKRAGTNNPVIMLDELDKLGNDHRGDPSSALLEVLDPKQNHAFVDRYLDVPFDLSNAMFICTANYIDAIPPALYDRLEIIDLPGYTDHDKLQIAKRYLVPRQIKEHGLTTRQVKFKPDALRKLIDDYTREAGVRELERQIASVCRAIAAQVAAVKRGRSKKTFSVDDPFITKTLGAEKYIRDLDTRTRTPGVVIGLAYTSVGGDILFIEATKYAGKGNLQLTGQLGDVMKESANAAMSLFKANAEKLSYDVAQLAKTDIHIHVPAGAVPKDGPSAGCAMYTALCSLLLGKPVKSKLAMTGEITLRGRVLPIGGVKEKSLAADRAGIKTILLPEDNRKDLEEVDPNVRKRVKFVFVSTAEDVLREAVGL